LIPHVFFKFFAWTELHRFEPYGFGTDIFLVHSGPCAFQCSAEVAQLVKFHTVTIGKPVAQCIADGLHDTHYHSVWHMLLFHHPFLKFFCRNGALGVYACVQWFLLAFATGVRCFVEVIKSTHIYIVLRGLYFRRNKLAPELQETNVGCATN